MNRRQLADNLAVSLTLGAWTAETTSDALRRRLPEAMHKYVSAISQEMLTELPGAYAPDPKDVAQALLLSGEFRQIFRYCARREIWPTPDLSLPVMAPTTPFADLNLPALPTLSDLAEWLLLPVQRLTYLADLTNRYEAHGETSVNHYHYLVKPKKSGDSRLIEAPKQQLKAVQRQILRGILDQVPPHKDAFGFVAGRSCLDAAQRHVAEEVVVSFDLRDFFPSISHARVLGLFRFLGYPLSVARHLAALCTNVTPPRIIARLAAADRPQFRHPHLPQGAPSSPALANLVAFTLDRRLSALAGSIGAHYSRYADDLSFSGERHIAPVLLRAVPGIVIEEGFCLNSAKTRVRPFTARQEVTGIGVNAHLNVSRSQYDQLKAVIHACGKPADLRLHDPAFRASLIGQLDWVERLNPRRGQKLQTLLAVAAAKQGL